MMTTPRIRRRMWQPLAFFSVVLVLTVGPGSIPVHAANDADVVVFSVPDGGGQQTCVLASPQDGAGGCTITLAPFGCFSVSVQTITIREPVSGTITLNVQIKAVAGGNYSVTGFGDDDGTPVSVTGRASDSCLVGRANSSSTGQLVIQGLV